MSTLNTTTSTTRPTDLNNTTDVGKSYFETDSNKILVWDGAAWNEWNRDSSIYPYVNNNFSGSFDGSADWIDCNAITAYHGASQMSLSFWWKPTSSGQGPSIGYRLAAGSDWGISGTNVLLRSASGTDGILTYTPPNDTLWHHYLLTFNAGTAALYIDGNSKNLSGTLTYTTLHSQTADFEIGRLSTLSSANGLFDEVALWTTALDSSNVSEIYQGDPNFDLSTDAGDYDQSSNLTHWWRLGDHASDTSSGGGAVADGNTIGNVENAANPGTNDGSGTGATYSSTVK